MNPFEWHGPEFLSLYLVVLGVGMCAALVVRWRMREPPLWCSLTVTRSPDA